MALPTFTVGASSRPAEYPPTTQRKEITGTLVADGTVGANPGDIPASVFGLTFIERCENAVKNDNTLVVPTAPSFDNASMLTRAASTHAPANIPAGTYSIIVFGY